MQKGKKGHAGSDAQIEQASFRQAGSASECMGYLLRRLKDQEDRERAMAAEIDSLKFKNSLLKAENEKQERTIEKLRDKVEECHCGSENRSRREDNQTHEIGKERLT